MNNFMTIEHLISNIDEMSGEEHTKACRILKMYHAADEEHQNEVLFETVDDAEEILTAWGYDSVLEDDDLDDD